MEKGGNSAGFSAIKRGNQLSANNIAISGVASRYATALFELAKEEGQLDEVAADLDALQAMVADSEDLSRLIESPVISREDQSAAVQAIAGKAGAHALTSKFLGVLAQQRRLYALSGVVSAYKTALAEDRGELKAEITSASELSDEQLETVKSAVSKFAGRAVSVETHVDPSLLSGLVVRVGSRMLDASLKTKLQQLEQSMRGLN